MLDGSAALHSFGEQPELYHELVRSLPSLLHASSDLASRADVQRDVLRLGAILTAHPSCVESADEYWIWERILEFALPLLEIDAAAEAPGQQFRATQSCAAGATRGAGSGGACRDATQGSAGAACATGARSVGGAWAAAAL